ncbi:MAG: hypothetical protein OXE50_15885 [Chloroflexi bacterium]|nr:hypothetical protein [Chloroflexota bacterium]
MAGSNGTSSQEYFWTKQVKLILKGIIKEKGITEKELCKIWNIEHPEKLFGSSTRAITSFHLFSFCTEYNISPSKIFHKINKMMMERGLK